MKKKSFVAGLKQVAGEGTAVCVFATLDVIDKDRDVTVPGAFGEQIADLAGAHQWQMPPLGVAKVHEIGKEAVADLKFNLDMPSAREWFSSMKFRFENGGRNQQFSYGFDVLDAGPGEWEGQQVRLLKKLRVHEVSPVMVGAGIDTRLLAIKNEKDVVESPNTKQFEIQTLIFPKMHWTMTQAKKWATDHDFRADKVDEVGETFHFRQREPDDFARLRPVCINPDRETAPNTEDCKVIAIGGPLKFRAVEAVKFSEHYEDALDELVTFVDRVQALAALRAKEGRVLSRANRERLSRLLELLSGVGKDISELLADTDPEKEAQTIMKLLAEFERQRASVGNLLGRQ